MVFDKRSLSTRMICLSLLVALTFASGISESCIYITQGHIAQLEPDKVLSNLPPVADAGGPYYGFEGAAVVFDGSASYDPDGDPLEHRWDFDGDNVWDTNWSSSPTASHMWYDDYRGNVSLQVASVGGEMIDVVIDGEPVAFGAVTAKTHLAQSFVPSMSTLTKVSLNVARNHGMPNDDLHIHIRENLSGPDLTNMSISPQALPYWDPFWIDLDFPDIAVTPGQTYYIVYTSSPSNNSGVYHTWAVWDSYPNGTAHSKTFPGGWVESPLFDEMIKTYGEGRQFSTDEARVTVQNVPPTPEWTSRSADGSILNPPYPEGKEILFESNVSDPGIHDNFTYDWDFGDGTILLDAGPSVTHTYGDNDSYIVVLKVTDDDGGVGIDDTPPLLTSNENPIPSINLPFCIFFEGLNPCSMIGEFTDPGWLDTHSAVWNFGDGEYEMAVITEENQPPDATGMNYTTHYYGDNGAYSLTFTVVDDDGGSGTASAEVLVQNLPPSLTIDAPATIDEGQHFLLGIAATDPGSDDLVVDIDWGDGTSDSEIYYNNGIGPDPPNSGPGVYPFTINTNFSHVYGDNGNFTVTVTVMDDDGGTVTKEISAVVKNVNPVLDGIQLFINASFSFRIAGEKWHNVEIHLYEDEKEIGYSDITRYPGSPNDQMVHLSNVSIDFAKRYSAVAYYTPLDDRQNGQMWGATPAWIILDFEDGDEWIHHTFNVRQEETWVWAIDDFFSYFLGHNITFVATASDPGSDDLTFIWDWGDGNTATHLYYNNGASPDPYPSPEINPILITDFATHAYGNAGTHSVLLTVLDDDGGSSQVVLIVTM